MTSPIDKLPAHDEAEQNLFEQWYSDGGVYPRAVDKNARGEYLLMGAQISWRAWQARAALNQAQEQK